MIGSRQRLIAVLASTAAFTTTIACGGSSSSSATGPTPTVVTETFTGSIGQNGSAVYNIRVASPGHALLAGFTRLNPVGVTALGLGIGTWDPATSTCGLNESQNDTSRSGSTALSGTAGAGAYCLRVYDAGNIGVGATATFTLQVQHY